jgi:hypothetical protein
MTNKQQVHSIKTNIERTIQGLRTKLQEFTYEQTGGFVIPNKLYSIYYTLGITKPPVCSYVNSCSFVRNP